MDYDVFISFPLTERKSSFKETINTKDFYIAKKIHSVLQNLLRVNTFFSDVSLLNNDKTDFWAKIHEVIPRSSVLVIVLTKAKDYERFYCAEERRLYYDSHPMDKRKVFFVCSKSVKRHVKEFDIFDVAEGKPEIILWEELRQQQKFYNFINNYFGKNEPGKDEEVLICTKCEKVFYKDNHIGTMCVHHDKSEIKVDEKALTVRFHCCNKVIQIENKNALFDIAPGCVEEPNHTFE